MIKKRKKYALGGLFGGGGGENPINTPSATPASYGPSYARVDPSRPQDINETNTLANYYKALRFRRSLTGSSGEMIPAINQAEMPEATTGMGGIGYTRADPRAIAQADSVINHYRANILPKRKMALGGSYTPTGAEAQTQQQANTLVNAVGAVNPLIGAGLKAGQAIGKASVDQDGLYKSKGGEFFTNSLDPTTGIQNLKDVRDNLTWGTAANQLSLGLVGKSATQIKREQAKRARLAKEGWELSKSNDARLGAMDYDFTGSNDGSLYGRFGGSLKKKEVTNVEGGQLRPLNSDTVEIEGNTHEQGGVQIPGAELEDEETVAGDFVFSDYLGFADRHKPIAKQIGKVEKKPINMVRANTLALLRKKEQALKTEQEETKAALGIQNEMTHQLGGPLTDPRQKTADYLNKFENNTVGLLQQNFNVRKSKAPITPYKAYASKNQVPQAPESERVFNKLDKQLEREGWHSEETEAKMRTFDRGDYYDKLQLAEKVYGQDIKDKHVKETVTMPTQYEDVPFKIGRMNTARVPSYLIDYAADVSEKQGTDPYKTLALMSRESTMGKFRDYITADGFLPRETVSAWNTGTKYEPMSVNNYLANRQTPGIKAKKSFHGWGYEVEDQEAAREAVNKGGQSLYDSYVKTVQKTPTKTENDFELAVKWLKDKQDVSKYNPGDPKYNDMFWQDYQDLKKEPHLAEYLKKRKRSTDNEKTKKS